MCGIAGYVGKDAPGKVVAMLGRLQYRGYDSAGVASVQENGLLDLRKDAGFLPDIVEKHKLLEMLGEVAIGHTRWATHGRVCKENSHPFADCCGQVAVVHNGIIDNHTALMSLCHGCRFTSETDSEVVVHLIERYLRRGESARCAIEEAVKQLEGSYALVILSATSPHSLFVARKESPLVIGWSREAALVASDYMAFVGHGVEYVNSIPEGEVVEVTAERPAQSRIFAMPQTAKPKESTGHYMLDEIREQPWTFTSALLQDPALLTATAIDILRARDVLFTACGSSRFAAIVGRLLFSKLAGRMSEVVVGSEFAHFTGSLTPSSLVIALSQSGETADVVSGIEAARKERAEVVSVVNREMSRLESLSDRVLHMQAGPEISVAATKSFTSELAILYLLAYTMGNKSSSHLQNLPDAISACLESRKLVEEVGKRLGEAKHEHIYYVAKGLNFAIAGECALKMKEISYIHAESLAAGELKHGTLALISEGTPIVGICPQDEMRTDMIRGLQEAKSRGAFVIGISDKNDSVFDAWLEVPEVDKLHYPVPMVVVGQLLAYYTAVARGVNPDLPKNLAKSVTVL